MILRAFSTIWFKTNSYVQEQVGILDDSVNIETSIVMPVFNQENNIQVNMSALSSNLGTISELIIINDASEDGTDKEILQFMNNFSPSQKGMCRIKYFSFRKQNFETFCDYFGVSQSAGKYIIEVQADMRIVEKDFDKKMIRSLKSNPDIFMLSGRGIMTFNDILENFRKNLGNEATANSSIFWKIIRLIFRTSDSRNQSRAHLTLKPNNVELFQPPEDKYREIKKAGRLGRLVDTNLVIQSENLYVGETVMRGPICFEKVRYYLVGQLNKDAFFLGFDEHDLNLRARINHNLKAGYLAISFESPLELGSMRKVRSKKSRLEVLLAVKRTQPYVKRSQLYRSAREGGITFNDHEIRTAN